MHDITVNKQNTHSSLLVSARDWFQNSPPPHRLPRVRDALDPYLKWHGKGICGYGELTVYEDSVFYWILVVKLPLKWLAVGTYSCWVVLSSHSLRFLIAVFLHAPLTWFPSFVFKKLFTYHCWNISHGIYGINIFSQSSTELLKLTMWKFMLL